MLERLTLRPGARRRPKRVGRGAGSGSGETAGRGVKGQGKRSPGRETPLYFEGGQMPLSRRLPKRGFRSRRRRALEIVNTGALAAFAEGATVDVDLLSQRGLVRGRHPVKLLAEGDVPRNLTVKVHRVSAAARAKIEQAGGRVEILT